MTVRALPAAALIGACLLTSLTAGDIERGPGRGASRCLIEWSERPSGGSERVLLRVYEDGLVEAEPPSGVGPHLQDRIDVGDANRLANEVARSLLDGDVTTASLKSERNEQARRTGLSANIASPTDSVLKVSSSEGTVQIACPAVDLLAERYAAAYRHQTLRDVQDRLGNVRSIVQAGGRESASELAAAASRQLKSEYPWSKDWDVEELAMVRTLASGTRLIQFRRKCVRIRPGGEEREWWITNIVETPGAPRQASVIAPDRVTR